MDTKKVVSALAVVFVVFFIIQSPTDAATIVRSIGHGLDHAANQLAEFLRKLS